VKEKRRLQQQGNPVASSTDWLSASR